MGEWIGKTVGSSNVNEMNGNVEESVMVGDLFSYQPRRGEKFDQYIGFNEKRTNRHLPDGFSMLLSSERSKKTNTPILCHPSGTNRSYEEKRLTLHKP